MQITLLEFAKAVKDMMEADADYKQMHEFRDLASYLFHKKRVEDALEEILEETESKNEINQTV